MKIKDLINNTEWLSVQYIMIELYPEVEKYLGDYKDVFYELKKLTPINSNIIIEMDKMWEDGQETNVAKVYGHDPSLPDESITKGIAIEFRPWEEWLEYEIGMDAKEEWSELEMICHAMIEMTLDGLTQEEIRINQKRLIGQALKLRKKYFSDKNLDIK